MLTLAEINNFIQNDYTSNKKIFARQGQAYYDGDHDIKKYRLFYYNADGVLVEDKTRSNVKIAHPYFTELVDQTTQYMLNAGKGGFIKSDLPELQRELDEYFNDNEDFTSELADVLTGCQVKGFEYMYAYKNDDDRLSFMRADSLGVTEVRAKDTDDGRAYVIYEYFDTNGKTNKNVVRVQIWDKEQTYYYIKDSKGKLIADPTEPLIPKPHILYTRDNITYYDSFGFIPFFRLDYNQKQSSGLKIIKDLIDDYDLMASSLSNNLIDFENPIHIVKGFDGDNLDELMQNLKTKKYIGMSTTDSGAGIDVLTVDVPFEARKIKLELDEKNIYRFGMGFNSAQLGDGNITNIVIKSRYALLDLKCNKLEIRLKQFLRKIIKVVLEEINSKNGTNYQMRDVYFDFKREVMTNAADNASIEKTGAETQQIRINTLLNLAAKLDDETLMQNICDALDISYEDIKGKLPKEDDDLTGVQIALDNMVGEAIE